jgi:protein phosphatase
VTDTPTARPLLAWGAATHEGRVRQENEDAYVAEPLVFVVADGMGGHQAGEVASAIAAGTLRDRLAQGVVSPSVVEAAVQEANAAIFHGAHTNPEQRGMGTTLTAMVVMSNDDATHLVVVNVGDSRTYVSRGGQLSRVTIDHSYVQELVSTGHITEAEARNHPRRNIVTRALGIEPKVVPDTWVLNLVRGDRYVLCSDGLVDEVEDIEIAGVLSVNSSPQAAAQALVDLANQHGGRDNTTVVVVDVLEGDRPPDATAILTTLEPDWGEAPDRLIDAEAGTPAPVVVPTTPRVASAASAAPSMMVSAVPVAGGTRRKGLGTLLFGLGLAAIVTVTVVLVMVVRHNSSDTPATTTTAAATTTVTPTTTTTLAPTTTAPRSTAPGASSPSVATTKG